jgi:hypothetical protein
MQELQWQGNGIRPYAARKSQKVWNQHQDIINTLYAERWTHNQIRKILKDEHGFNISKGQLRRRLLQAPARNRAAISSRSPISRSRRRTRVSKGESRVPQRAARTTESRVPAASPPSPSDHAPDPPVCHLDSSSVRLSMTGAPLSESVEDVLRRFTILLDEGIEADINPSEVPTIVTNDGFESILQQASQTNISVPELPDTILIHYQPTPHTTTDTLHTNTTLDGLYEDMEVDPSNDFPTNIGSIMPKGWSGTIESKGVDEFQAELWAQIRRRRVCKEKATCDTATSGKPRLLRPIRDRTTRVCCVCRKTDVSKVCESCQHARCSSCS